MTRFKELKRIEAAIKRKDQGFCLSNFGNSGDFGNFGNLFLVRVISGKVLGSCAKQSQARGTTAPDGTDSQT